MKFGKGFGKGTRKFKPVKSEVVNTEYLTVREASIKYRVDHTTLRSWIDKGVLPHTRVGPEPGLIRLRDCDLARVVTPADQDMGESMEEDAPGG